MFKMKVNDYEILFIVVLLLLLESCSNPEKHEHIAVSYSILTDEAINSIKLSNFSDMAVNNIEIFKNNEEIPFISISYLYAFDDTLFKRKEYIPKITLADKLVIKYQVEKKKFRCVYYLANSYKYEKDK